MVSNKILVICGPTATGKTALGVRLAKRFGGEIVSADSRQVYKGMDIGTGKDLGELKGIPVWLLDVALPNEDFSVAKYLDLAWKAIKDIWSRDKSRPTVEDPRHKVPGLPIIVGGTGFYIKAITDGIGTLGIPPDWGLRRRLADEDIETLGERLKKVDPQRWERMNESDRKNPRRLVRAIEVAGRQPKAEYHKPEAFFIGLMAPCDILYRRIDERVDKRVKEGIEEEIKGLMAEGYHFEDSVLGSTIGYKEWCSEKTREEIIQRWKFDEHDLARRQMTWFRKDQRINWFDIGRPDWEKEVEKVVKKWYIRADDQKS